MKKHVLFLALMCASILTICGCSAAASPVASFTSNVTHGIAPLSVQFIDTSTGNVTSWSCNFGNGATSTQQNPTYTYIYAGKY
ncbi:PKD domain-containing protein, partial [Methanobacterium sp.]|uniref:PKD domain-containing protein n=1 Tax=Methanobacterium sp. TaxID=2164 RepID=UPI003C75FB6D